MSILPEEPGQSERLPVNDAASASREFGVADGQADETASPVSLGSRLLQPRTLFSFALGIAIMALMFRGLDINLRDVWSEIRNANPALYLAAFLTYYSAIVFRAIRWRMMLRQAGLGETEGYRLPRIGGTSVIITLSLFVNCVVPARLGDAYRSYLLRERNGASFGVSFGTILAERLIDVVVMVGVVLAAGAVVFGTNVPGRAEQAFLLGLGVVVLGVVGVVVMYVMRDRLESMIPNRFSGHYRRLSEGIFTILAKPFPYVGIGVLIWIFDGLRVYFIAHALGADLSFPESIVVSLLSALVTIVPFTPAGIGVVEGFMFWMLPQLGVAENTAVAVALLDRSITYFSLIVIGVPLYLYNLKRTVTLQDEQREIPTGSETTGQVPS